MMHQQPQLHQQPEMTHQQPQMTHQQPQMMHQPHLTQMDQPQRPHAQMMHQPHLTHLEPKHVPHLALHLDAAQMATEKAQEKLAQDKFTTITEDKDGKPLTGIDLLIARERTREAQEHNEKSGEPELTSIDAPSDDVYKPVAAYLN